ncbi:unnamed protein product [Gordionus sp. m RMFG-2023]
MGAIFTKFNYRTSPVIIIENIDRDISKLNEICYLNTIKLKKYNRKLLVFSSLAMIIGLIGFKIYLPSSWKARFFFSCILVIIPLMAWFLRNILKLYYRFCKTNSDIKIKQLIKKRNNIIDNIKKTETYENALEILEKIDYKHNINKHENTSFYEMEDSNLTSRFYVKTILNNLKNIYFFIYKLVFSITYEEISTIQQNDSNSLKHDPYCPIYNQDITPKNIESKPHKNIHKPHKNMQLKPPKNIQLKPPKNIQPKPQISIQPEPSKNIQHKPYKNIHLYPQKNIQIKPHKNIQSKTSNNIPYKAPNNVPYKAPNNNPYKAINNAQHKSLDFFHHNTLFPITPISAIFTQSVTYEFNNNEKLKFEQSKQIIYRDGNPGFRLPLNSSKHLANKGEYEKLDFKSAYCNFNSAEKIKPKKPPSGKYFSNQKHLQVPFKNVHDKNCLKEPTNIIRSKTQLHIDLNKI